MSKYEITFGSVSIPSGSSISVTVEEDSDNDGTVENSDTISLSNGTTSYTTADVFAQSGQVRLQYSFSGSVTATESISGPVNVGPAVQAPSQPSASLNVVANDQIDVSVSPPSDWGNEVGNYRVEILRDGGSWRDPSGGPSTPSGSTSTQTYSYGPNSDTAYDRQVGIDSSFRFRVRAENSSGNSGWDYTGTKYTEAIPPNNPSVSRPDSTTFKIHFDQQSDIGSGVVVEARKDTGSGYGSWDWLDTCGGSGHTISQGDGENISIDEDARYQLRLYNYVSPDRSADSVKVSADYGNAGNVYFEDDFEDNDVSEWDTVNGGGWDVRSGSGPADLQISGADTGSYYFYGEGEDATTATHLQKDLGDLSGETDVHVRCAFATASLDSGNENFGISWYDGSNWQVLETRQWEYNRQGWYEVHATVPDSYLSTNNQVRVGMTSGSGMYAGDHFAVDRVVVSDILHEYTKPSTPSNLSLDTSVEGEITASWTVNHTNFSGGVDSRSEVWYKKTSASSYVNGPNYLNGESTSTITGLRDGERYDFFIRAGFSQHRNGSYSKSFLADTPDTEGTTLLPAPTTPSASITTGQEEIALSWSPQDNNPNGSIHLERSTDGFSTATTVATFGDAGSSYTDTGVNGGTTYEYRVERTTNHAESTSGSASQRAPLVIVRSSALSGSAVLNGSGKTSTKSRDASLNADATVDALRAKLQPRDVAVSAPGGDITTSRLYAGRRNTRLNCDASITNESKFLGVFPAELTYGDIDWEFVQDYDGFVSQWVYRPHIGSHGSVAVYIDGKLTDTPIYLEVEYINKGVKPNDFDVIWPTEQSQDYSMSRSDEVAVFDSLSASAGYYRVIMRNLEPRDVLSKVILGTTHT